MITIQVAHDSPLRKLDLTNHSRLKNQPVLQTVAFGEVG